MKTDAIQTTITPSWERARDLLGKVRQSLQDWIALGDEIAALQAQFSAQGIGGGNFSRSSSSPGRSDEKGWQERVERELGISKQTALRIMEKAIFLRNLQALAAGKDVTYVDTDGETKTIKPNGDRITLANTALERVIDGEVNARRAFVGVIGEGDRRERSIDGHRSEANYSNLIVKSAPTICNAFTNWGRVQLGEDDRKKVHGFLYEAVLHMPPEIKTLTIKAIKDWPKHDKAALLKALK
jgi:hypothetical protein